MFGLDDIGDFIEDNVLDPVEDLIDGATGWVDDNIVDPLVETAESFGDLLEEAWEGIEDFADRMAEIAEEIAGKVEDAWEHFRDKAENFLSDLAEGLSEGWNSVVEGLERGWEWLQQKVHEAVSVLAHAGSVVVNALVEEVIPWVVSIIRLPWVIARFIGALVALGVCWLASRFVQPEEIRVMRAITDGHPRTLEDFRIARLPVEDKYVAFSDLHFFPGVDYDFYEQNGNGNIHRWALTEYAKDGYHVIDNGDVEDFWMRGGSTRGHLLSIADMLPYPAHYDAFNDLATLSLYQAHAAQTFLDNIETYGLVDELFVQQDRYTRTIGNHDDAWDDERMLPVFDLVYSRPIVANDYILLENSGTGEAEFIFAHGHQSDAWNMRLCDYAGKTVTNTFSSLTEVSFHLIDKVKTFYKKREDWEDELTGYGFDNELRGMRGLLGSTQSLDEVELYEKLEDIYEDDPIQPHLVLGHTHNIKHDTGIPGWGVRHWDDPWPEYSNTGTTGMWEGGVSCLEIDHGEVTPVLWYADQTGKIIRDTLEPYRYADAYLK